MKIDYPQIEWADIQPGDTILVAWVNTKHVHYSEFVVDTGTPRPYADASAFYLIDRPKPVFPEEYGSIIIAKKVRGIEFPEGVALTRQRGGYSSSYQGPAWKSLGIKISGADNHGERQIEDWVLAKVVPA
jgi:hypothetical protein